MESAHPLPDIVDLTEESDGAKRPCARYSVRSVKTRLAIGADILRYQTALGAGRQSTWLSEYLEAKHGKLSTHAAAVAA